MKQKLYAQQGATITAALLFFLVAAVCGSLILAAATATLSRITTQAEDARAYYSLTSAAQLMREDILNSHWKVTKTITAGTSTYTVSALDADGNEDAKTFIPDLLSGPGGAESSPVFKNTDNIEIKTTASGETLPLVYARPNPITFKTLFDNYDAGANTQLRILLTNDPEGFDESGNPKFNNTYKDKEGNKTDQGADPFYSIYTNGGERLSKYVTYFNSMYKMSKNVYSDIKDNIENLIENAINNKAPR